MRLSDLLGSEVFDAAGHSLGHVHDVQLVADGPAMGAFGSALRIHGIVVGRGSTGARLGLSRDAMRGPWLLKAVFGRRPQHLIAWEKIVSIGDASISLAE